MSQQEHPDDALEALLRDMPQPEPSAALDQRILAQAEKALAAPQAANDHDYPAARRPFLQRYRVPLGLAATVLIAANLVLLEPAQTPAPQREAAEMVAPQVALVADTVPAPPAVTQDSVAVAPSAAAPKVNQETRKAASARIPAATPVVAQEAAPPPVPTVAAVAAAPMAERAPVAAAAEVQPVAAAPALAAAPPAAPAPAPLTRVLVTGSSISRQAPADAYAGLAFEKHFAPQDAAETALAKIITLEKLNNPIATMRAWQAFKLRFPQHPVDPALRARLDALTAPPEGD